MGVAGIKRYQLFLSTLPVRGATDNTLLWHSPQMISIHAPREGSDVGQGVDSDQPVVISIHAPREGSDGLYSAGYPGIGGISIHAPREGSDRRHRLQGDGNFISIHAPREGSDHPRPPAWPERAISIHAPREGSDPAPRPTMQKQVLFLSTLPARGATPAGSGTGLGHHHFYPRSPRGERRRAGRWPPSPGCDFYPRSPRGERPSGRR